MHRYRSRIVLGVLMAFIGLVLDANAADACERIGGVATTEQRGGVEVAICSSFGPYTDEIVQTFQPLCGNVTTETRGGEQVVVCTP